MTRQIISVLTTAALAGSALAEPASPPDLALQARAVLRKYCVECHRPGAGQKGELDVLSSAGLAPAGRVERPFLAKSADAAQLLQLIDDGSMPPGNRAKPNDNERRIIREWLTAGATSYAATYDDGYVLSAILADVNSLPEEQRRTARYISLHHAVSDSDPTLQLESKRQAVRDAVADLSRDAMAPGPKGIDPAQVVLRVDLKQTGWDFKPFRHMHLENGKEVFEDSNVNLFDLVGIEYPFGVLEESETFAQLRERFFAPVPMAAPVAFFRADWFVDDFARSAVAQEIRSTLFDPVRLRARKAVPPPAAVFPKPTVKLVGTPIIPLDSVLRRDYFPDPPPFDIDFDTLDLKTMARRSDFVSGDKLALRVRASKPVFIEVVWTDAAGKCDVPDLNSHAVKANESTLFRGQRDEGFELEATGDGFEYLTIFASESRFAAGQMLKTKEHLNERVVHTFYASSGTKPDAASDPARIVKKTVRIKIKPK